MPASLRIWIEVTHHAAFRIGGWTALRQAGGELTGFAGGDRRIDAERAGLLAFAAALKDLPANQYVEVLTASPLILAIPRRIAEAKAGKDPPTDNLDLWAQADTALKRPGLTLRRAEPAPKTPTAFASAWAALALDRAKDKGPFQAAIPKPNLARAGV